MKKTIIVRILCLCVLSMFLTTATASWAEEEKVIKTLKPYPEYFEFLPGCAWYAEGTGIEKIKQAPIEVIGVINKENVEQYKDELSLSLYTLIKEWGYTQNIVRGLEPGSVPASKGYRDATERNKTAQITINPDDLSLGNYSGGLPFFEPKNADEAIQNWWNRYTADRIRGDYAASIYDTKGKFRAIDAHQVRAKWVNKTDLEPIPAYTPNPTNIEAKQWIVMIYPSDSKGTIILTLRYFDAKDDDQWTYVPSMRRVRRFSTAQRSDSFGGMHICLDDFWTFDGKLMNFTYKGLVEKDLYIGLPQNIRSPIMSSPQAPWGDPRIKTKEGPTRATFPDTMAPARLDGTYKELIGSYQNILVSKRPCYSFEIVAKDPNYLYSRKIMYVDKETWETSSNEMYDQRGEFWKTMIIGLQVPPVVNPDRGTRVIHSNAIAIDMKAGEGDWIEYSRILAHNYPFPSVDMDPEDITVTFLKRAGR